MLLAVGAVLAIAVDYQVTGIDVNAIGVILMVVGLIGLLLSLTMLGRADWFGRAPADHVVESPSVHTHTREVVREVDPPVSETTTTRTTRRL